MTASLVGFELVESGDAQGTHPGVQAVDWQWAELLRSLLSRGHPKQPHDGAREPKSGIPDFFATFLRLGIYDEKKPRTTCLFNALSALHIPVKSATDSGIIPAG